MPVANTALGARKGPTPIRRVYKGSSLIIDSKTNLFPDPEGATTTPWIVTLGTVTNTTGYNGSTSCARHTRNAVGAARFSLPVGLTMAPLTTYTFLVVTRASVALSATAINFRPDVNTSTGQVALVTQTVAAGITPFVFTFTTLANAMTVRAGFSFINSSGGVGATLDVTQIGVFAGTHTLGYRYGGSPGWAWEGSANASPSYGWN